MSTIQIGVDLAKTVFEVAISDAPAEVLLEACGSAHHWGREAQRCGHRVTLLHPADVARYRDGTKGAHDHGRGAPTR